MANYVAKAAVVKVSIGEAGGNRVARIIREGAPIPEGVPEEQLKSLADRGLIRKVTARRAAAAAKDDDAGSSDAGSAPDTAGDDK